MRCKYLRIIILLFKLCLFARPEILKQEIKVFFVKYNDPIYVKLEKLDIMIRLASQANIAQVRLPQTTSYCIFTMLSVCVYFYPV